MGIKPYTKVEQELALKEFERLGSVTAVIQKLGYPSRQTLYQWYERKKAGCLNNHGTMEYKDKTSPSVGYNKYKHVASFDLKKEILKRCFEDGEPVEYVSREIGYSRVTIYKWREIYLKAGDIGLMPKKSKIERKKFIEENSQPKIDQSIDVKKMQQKIDNLELELDILKETINVLKKDPGINIEVLTNKEKMIIVDALKIKYSIPLLLNLLNFSRSSYYYHCKKNKIDKYSTIKKLIINIFYENRECYGYRRIHGVLKNQGYKISEKIVRKIMKEENLIVYKKKKKKYSSYKGEISPEVKNIINRDFHAEKPNEKWLTDITEFSHPEGKVYLSPIIDCFDGKVVSWTVGKSPNARLVNSMLTKAINTLSEKEFPLVHSDRGCHYRWTKWIEIMNDAQLIRSMSKKGCSPDNSACEGFFGRMKNEFYYGKTWQHVSINRFMMLINEYINWYNEKRIKKSLGYLSPIEYRKSLGITA
jgi:transposase InsO family protein/transposase-like protein